MATTIARVEPATTPRANGAARQPGLVAALRMEWYKLCRWPTVWVTAFLAIPGVGGMMILRYLLSRSANIPADQMQANLAGVLLPGGITGSFDVVDAFTPIFLIVCAGSLAGSEYGWGTIRVLVGSGASRVKLLLAKAIALLGLTTFYVIGGVLAGTVASLLVTLVNGSPVTLGAVDVHWILTLIAMFGRSILASFIIATLAFAVGSLLRSTAAGIAFGIGWMIAESIVGAFLVRLGDLGETASKLLISTNMQALLRYNTFGAREIPASAPGLWQATGALVLYSLVLIAAAVVVFRRRDIASGS